MRSIIFENERIISLLIEDNNNNLSSYLHVFMSGGELLELRLLDTQLLDTFGRKSTARHFFCQLLESS